MLIARPLGGLAHVVNSGLPKERHLCLISNNQVGIGELTR